MTPNNQPPPKYAPPASGSGVLRSHADLARELNESLERTRSIQAMIKILAAIDIDNAKPSTGARPEAPAAPPTSKSEPEIGIPSTWRHIPTGDLFGVTGARGHARTGAPIAQGFWLTGSKRGTDTLEILVEALRKEFQRLDEVETLKLTLALLEEMRTRKPEVEAKAPEPQLPPLGARLIHIPSAHVARYCGPNALAGQASPGYSRAIDIQWLTGAGKGTTTVIRAQDLEQFSVVQNEAGERLMGEAARLGMTVESHANAAEFDPADKGE